jgi:hypothetical protein
MRPDRLDEYPAQQVEGVAAQISGTPAAGTASTTSCWTAHRSRSRTGTPSVRPARPRPCRSALAHTALRDFQRRPCGATLVQGATDDRVVGWLRGRQAGLAVDPFILGEVGFGILLLSMAAEPPGAVVRPGGGEGRLPALGLGHRASLAEAAGRSAGIRPTDAHRAQAHRRDRACSVPARGQRRGPGGGIATRLRVRRRSPGPDRGGPGYREDSRHMQEAHPTCD